MAGIVPDLDHAKAWPFLWPMLEKAAKRSDLSESAVQTAVLSGDAQLWAILDNGAPVAAVTTQITLHEPKGCRLWLVGGSRMDEWANDFLGRVEPWAKSLGCAVLWGTQSRKGWKRIVKMLGGEPIEMDGKAAWARRL